MPQIEGIFPITTKSGIKRDGTPFDGPNYVDGKWCRFQRGRPRKIKGYRQMQSGFAGPVRGCYLDGISGFNYTYSGSRSNLQMFVFDDTGAGSGLTDITPAGFPASPNNVWQMDSLYNAGGNNRVMLYHGAPNLTIDSVIQTPIYYNVSGTLTAPITTGTSVSGGVFTLPPYAMALDNDGYVQWTGPNLPTAFGVVGSGGGIARIAPSKLIKGMRCRGGSGAAPAALIWSLDELYRAFFVGGVAIFEFDYIGDTELLSTQAVVEVNGQFYWPDLNGFKNFNGTINDLPNDMNLNYFYDNLNVLQRQKVWGFKNPRYNEIWWMYPAGQAIECNEVIIYNYKEQAWYDTTWAIDQQARSSGIFSKSFPYPIMFGLDQDSGGHYSLWEHEFGYDRIDPTGSYAIDSYFETADLSYCAVDAGFGFLSGTDKWLENFRVEPDFVQSGNMTLIVRGQPYATQPSQDSAPYLFTPTTNKIDMKEQRRQMRLRFENNTLGGNYEMGKVLITAKAGDGRQ